MRNKRIQLFYRREKVETYTVYIIVVDKIKKSCLSSYW